MVFRYNFKFRSVIEHYHYCYVFILSIDHVEYFYRNNLRKKRGDTTRSD